MWNLQHFLACISRPQSRHADLAFTEVVVAIQESLSRVTASLQMPVVWFFPTMRTTPFGLPRWEKGEDIRSPYLPWSVEQVLTIWQWMTIKDSQKACFQSWLKSSCQHLSLVQDPWTEDQGGTAFLRTLWNPSFDHQWDNQLWFLPLGRYQDTFFFISCTFLITFLTNIRALNQLTPLAIP